MLNIVFACVFALLHCFRFMSLHHSDRITSEISIAWRYGRLSDHILPLLDVHQCAGYPVAMVLPYRAHQPLRDRMARMTLRQVQSYMRGLLIALSCMHKFNLIHRDGEDAHRWQRGRANLVGRRSGLQRTKTTTKTFTASIFSDTVSALLLRCCC